MEETATTYIITKLLFQRGLALVYVISFLVAINQFIPLLGENGLLPVPQFIKHVRFFESPSLFFAFPTDLAFRAAAWFGFILSLAALFGITERFGSLVSAMCWGILWVIYLSFVNIGQTFYSFGWESMLLEGGFYAMFLGGAGTSPPTLVIWMIRWMLFRTMFGAGLIKLRGDECWRDLTCLFYHYETQPMPNLFSWSFHWLPRGFLKLGVVFNHVVEIFIPFLYFFRGPLAAVGGIITILFHGLLIVSGNFSFLSLLTIVLAISTLDDQTIHLLFRLPLMDASAVPPPLQQVTIALAILVAILSIQPILNLLSPRQMMNTGYNPFHLVNSYGAFGSITRPRYEIIVEGTDELVMTEGTKWKEYEFKGKPGDVRRTPPQIAPYHLRLDWLMWFAGFSSSYQEHPWFINFVAKLLQGDQKTLGLLRANPFPDKPPTYIRASRYLYEFTTPEEKQKTGNIWKRSYVAPYFFPVSLQNKEFTNVLKAQEWIK